MDETTVVNKYKSEYDIYIGRGSKWGNPFSHKEGTKADFIVSTREEAIGKYKHYVLDMIESNQITLDEIRSLKGQRLGCFCKPKPCHGDFLAYMANNLER